MVKNLPSVAEDIVSIPGRGTKTPTCPGAIKPTRRNEDLMQLNNKILNP